MTKLHSDTNNVLESLAKATSNYDEGELLVYDTLDARIVALTRAAVKERNLFGTEMAPIDDLVCTIEWTVTEWDNHTSTHLELKFHESEVDSPLYVKPAGPDAIAPDQATDPTELGPRLETALTPLKEEGAIFTFAEVSAASMAHGGHYTNFKYEYSIDGLEV